MFKTFIWGGISSDIPFRSSLFDVVHIFSLFPGLIMEKVYVALE